MQPRARTMLTSASNAIPKQIEEYKAFSLVIASSFILRAGPSVHTPREMSGRTAIRGWLGALLY